MEAVVTIMFAMCEDRARGLGSVNSKAVPYGIKFLSWARLMRLLVNDLP